MGAALVAALAVGVVVLVTQTSGTRAPAIGRTAVPSPHGLTAVESGVAVALFNAGAVARIEANGRIAFRVAVGRHPTNPVAADGALWVPVVGDRRLVELNASSGKVERRLAGAYASAVAGPPGSLFLSAWPAAPAHPTLWRGNAVARLDTRTGRTVWRRAFSGIALTVAYRAGRVWVPDFAGLTLHVIRSTTGASIADVRLPARPLAVAVGDDCGWIALAGGTLLRVDPVTLHVEGRTSLHGDNVDYMVVGDHGVWLTRYASPSAAVLEHVACATGLVDDTRAVGGASQGLAVDGTNVWVADYGEGAVLRLAEHP